MFIEVKNPPRKTNLARKRLAFFFRRKVLAAVLGTLVLIGLWGASSLYFLYLGAKLHRDKYIAGFEQTVHYVADTGLRIPMNYVRGQLTADPQQLALDIKQVDMLKIAHARMQSFEAGQVVPNEPVPAKLTCDGRSLNAKVSLHGFMLDHVASNQWSLDVQLKGGQTVLGMNRFKLMAPKIRYGIYEWVCHELSRREGLIALRTDFVDVKINGENKGIYQLEEALNKGVVEHNRRREGILFSPVARNLDVHENKRIVSDPAAKEQVALLESLYERFLNGELPASQLFDVEKLAKYYAISDLVAGSHQLVPGNMQMYFNPITGLIEPIGREWDVHFYRPQTALVGELVDPFVINHIHPLTLADEVIFKQYVHQLERISQPEFLDTFFREVDEQLDAKLRILHLSFPHYSFSKDYFRQGQQFIAARLSRKAALRAYLRHHDDGTYELVVHNRDRLPLELVEVLPDPGLAEQPKLPVTIARRTLQGGDGMQVISLGKAAPPGGWPQHVRWRVLGAEQIEESEVRAWPFAGDLPRLDFLRLEPNHHECPFIKVDEQARTLSILPGEWTLNQSLVLPAGFTVRCGPGTTITLDGEAGILSRSTLEFVGEPDHPIVIRATENASGGLLILSAPQRSILEYVHVSGLSNPADAGWQLTGGVTFYESDVDIFRCWFGPNRHGDDVLNIVRSDFALVETQFRQSVADAVDIDFGTGRVVDCQFIACGNDAIDVSGTTLAVENVTLDGIGDKGLSAGEESQMSVKSAVIKNAEISVASKDGSRVSIDDLSLVECAVGVTAFQKKPEFGKASVVISRLRQNQVERPLLLERGCSIELDGKAIEPTMDDVKSILYGVEYGKSSR